MNQVVKAVGTSVLLLGIALSSLQAKTAYVSDMLILTFREGPGTNYTVLKTLRSNTPLTVIEEGEEYDKVQLDSGEEGWVDKQFITYDLPKAQIIEQLKAENQTLQEKMDDLTQRSGQIQETIANTKSDAQKKHSVLEEQLTLVNQENDQLKTQLEAAQKELLELKAASKHVVATLEANKQLSAETQRLSKELSEMEKDHSHLFRTSMIKWFLAGVGVLLAGWLIGLMLSSRRRSRSSLLS